jgi:hypothetical protein
MDLTGEIVLGGPSMTTFYNDRIRQSLKRWQHKKGHAEAALNKCSDGNNLSLISKSPHNLIHYAVGTEVINTSLDSIQPDRDVSCSQPIARQGAVSMNIEITINKNEKVLLRANELNYELCWIKRHTDEVSGEVIEEWVPKRYFASLSQAMVRLLDLKVRASDARTLLELKADIEKGRAELVEAWHITPDITG